MLSVTGRTQPLKDPKLHAAASAKGGTGISGTVTHRSAPLESAKQCLAATAACREVKVTTAYVESRANSSTTRVLLDVAHLQIRSTWC